MAALVVSAPLSASAGPQLTGPYESQLGHAMGIVEITGPLRAAAQEFTTVHDRVDTASAYLVSTASTGTLTAEIRTDPTDPTSALGRASVELARLGGGGRGWVELTFDPAVPVELETTYALVLQTEDADGTVVWSGRKSTGSAARPGWSYDGEYGGGWRRYDVTAGAPGADLAFSIAPGTAAACAVRGACFATADAAPARLHWDGILSNDTHVVGVGPAAAAGHELIPYSDVLRTADGRLRYLPDGAREPVTVPAGDPGALARIAADRAWLDAGLIPGRTEDERRIAARALLDMRALLQPGGAVVAAWWSIWTYAWPRDGSFVAAALTHTGHPDEALEILHFFAEAQHANGTWEARYHPDGSAVDDGRHWQLDGNGWIPWAVWQWYESAPAQLRDADLRELWPMVRTAADYAAGSLRRDGLPAVSPDYWENSVRQPTISTSAALLSGLHAATDLAIELDEQADATRWAVAAEQLQRSIDDEFGPHGYPRTPGPRAGADSLVTVLMPPFVPETVAVRTAVLDAAAALTLPNGGILPGEDWRGDPRVAWTPETAMFALQAAATGRDAEADRWLGWLYAHRTALGSFPEKVGTDGRPASVGPLAWTASLVVLSLVGLDEGLPTPPDPCPGPDAGLCAS